VETYIANYAVDAGWN